MNRKYNYIYCGYLDFINREPYKRAPGNKCPKVPDYMLPRDWQEYFEGWNSAANDAVRGIGKYRNIRERVSA